ncbi:hypothetical protein E3N88_20574 [Mikania micrantha]|uniref:Uncharacterized protein n=1 Tax=Mikania micrantha TaxID=192012 RepID=A0A5N6NHD4_9ASTR|nr:hypothetical protein E3N88_20574 [Mikania micrantha]
MKLGLLCSTGTHRGTRWAPKWAFAAREAQAGEFEFSKIHRGTRRPIIFLHRGDQSSSPSSANPIEPARKPLLRHILAFSTAVGAPS